MKLSLFHLNLLVNFFSKPPIKLKNSKKILLPLQTNDAQAMLLCSKTVLEIVFQQTVDLNFKKVCFETHYGGTSRR